MKTTALALETGAPPAGPVADLSIWLIDLDHEDDAAASLPEAVLQRASRFVRAIDRRRYLASQRALRALVPHGHSTAGAHGKPALVSGPHFNLSRRDGWAAVARSRAHEVGVDLETLRRVDDAAELAALHFTPAERAAVDAASGEARDRAFLTVWTRKEACMKATGLGLSLAPSSFECGAQAASRRVTLTHEARGWTVLVHTPVVALAPVVVSWAVVLPRERA